MTAGGDTTTVVDEAVATLDASVTAYDDARKVLVEATERLRALNKELLTSGRYTAARPVGDVVQHLYAAQSQSSALTSALRASANWAKRDLAKLVAAPAAPPPAAPGAPARDFRYEALALLGVVSVSLGSMLLYEVGPASWSPWLFWVGLGTTWGAYPAALLLREWIPSRLATSLSCLAVPAGIEVAYWFAHRAFGRENDGLQPILGAVVAAVIIGIAFVISLRRPARHP
jgi:hypothetical protein